MPLLELPQTILEDIIGFAVDMPASSSGALRYNKSFRLADRLRGKYPVTRPSRDITAISLLCSSRCLSTLTYRILLQRGVFDARTGDAMEEFLDDIGEDALPLVRHFDWTVFSERPPRSSSSDSFEEDYDHPPPDIAERLPPTLKLHSLRLQYFGGAKRTRDDDIFSAIHPSFRPGRIQTFKAVRELRELELDYSMFAEFDIFWAESPWSDRGLEPRDPSNGPAFPALRRLLLRGCSVTNVFDARVIKALSEEQLPSLQILQIFCVMADSHQKGRKVSLINPELLLAIHPLSEFEWISYRCVRGDCDRRPIRLQDRLSRAHLAALKERHRETLRSLTIDCDGCRCVAYCPREIDCTKEEIMEFLREMPALVRVSIRASQIGVLIGEQCSEEDGSE